MKAKVFISWSGAMSQAVAKALRDWLPSVIQAVEPWMSADDIGKGIRWRSELANQLQQTRVGVICLTPENLESPWLHFEAGALSKTVKDTYVCPYLFELEPADISGPLTQFQVTMAEKEDTRKLVHRINQALKDEVIPEAHLNKYFDRWWPDLEKQLEGISRMPETSEPQRSDREILEEILESVRGLKRVSFSTIQLMTNISEISRLLKARSHDPDTFGDYLLTHFENDFEAVQILSEIAAHLFEQQKGGRARVEKTPVSEDATSNDT